LLSAQGIKEFPQYVQLQFTKPVAGRVEVSLGAGRELTRLIIDVEKQQVLFDRNKSGLVKFSDKFTGVQRAPFNNQQDQLKLELYIDRSSVEIFINDGELVFTNQIFPTHFSSTKKQREIFIKTNKPLELSAASLGYF
jgi:fructan beta-fructosidase